MLEQHTEQAERDETRPVARIGYLLGRLDRVYRLELNAALREVDLTVATYTTLSVLRHRSDLSNAQLARRALVTPQAMNQIVQQLQAQKLIAGRQDADHRRVLRMRLTARGRRLVDRCDRKAAALEDKMREGMTETARSDLDRLVQTCLQNLGAGI